MVEKRVHYFSATVVVAGRVSLTYTHTFVESLEEGGMTECDRSPHVYEAITQNKTITTTVETVTPLSSRPLPRHQKASHSVKQAIRLFNVSFCLPTFGVNALFATPGNVKSASCTSQGSTETRPVSSATYFPV